MNKAAKIKLSVSSFILSFVVFGTSAAVAGDFDVAAKYAQTCAVCHASGVAGAPKKGDAAAWEARNAKGQDALLASVKNGMNAMPAMGLCADCSDDNLLALIKHLNGTE